MTLQRSRSKLITILAHILMWALFAIAIFFYHPLFSGIEIPLHAWVTQSVTLSLLIVGFYVNVFILVPRFLLKNQLVYYFVAVILIIAAIVLVNGWVEDALDPHWGFLAGRQNLASQPIIMRSPGKPFRKTLDRPTIIISALVLGIGTSITAIQKWQKDKQQREELERDKVTTELSFLKAQVNPHFFFNTLNNIYALTAIDAELAGKAVHQLSRMMRYLLYDTQHGHTMLSQEIAFVNDYISLMQLRLTDAVKISMHTPPNLLDMPVAPMLFLPFVENAFKHGVSATQPSHIDIVIAQQDKVLDLMVRNSIMKDNSVSLDTNSGIGLVNTKRRLDLLYPGKYQLDINKPGTGNEYFVHLVLNLP